MQHASVATQQTGTWDAEDTKGQPRNTNLHPVNMSRIRGHVFKQMHSTIRNLKLCFLLFSEGIHYVNAG
jgi:hypothetical protein